MGVKFALTLVPMTISELIQNTNVFWTSILSLLFLNEVILSFEYLSMVLAFAGIMMIVLNKDESEGTGGPVVDQAWKTFGIICVFAGSWGQAGMYTLNR